MIHVPILQMSTLAQCHTLTSIASELGIKPRTCLGPLILVGFLGVRRGSQEHREKGKPSHNPGDSQPCLAFKASSKCCNKVAVEGYGSSQQGLGIIQRGFLEERAFKLQLEGEGF